MSIHTHHVSIVNEFIDGERTSDWSLVTCPSCLRQRKDLAVRTQPFLVHHVSVVDDAGHRVEWLDYIEEERVDDWTRVTCPFCLQQGRDRINESRQQQGWYVPPHANGEHWFRPSPDNILQCNHPDCNRKDTPTMTTIPFTLTNESITVILNGRPITVHKGSAQYPGLRTALFSEQWDRIESLVTVRGSLAAWFKGTGFDINMEGVMRYGELDVPESLSRRIQAMVAAGNDPGPMIKFYQRLAKNPSYRSRMQLFSFLTNVGIPIEPDGTFLAYKGVRDDMHDVHSGKFDNTPGTHHSMPRNRISDDPDLACHVGFHVGALSYAKDFGPTVVICRVDPEHVVCVPKDESQRKMRVCDYDSIGFWNGEAMPSTTFAPSMERDASLDEEIEDDAGDADWENDNLDTSTGVGDGGDGFDARLAGIDKEITELEADVKKSSIRKVKTKAAALARLTPAKLMERGIDELRKYASGHLKIVGASKMAGGKSSLVSAILKARKKRRK